MAIQRYTVKGTTPLTVEVGDSEGLYVLYADHLAECRAREKAAYLQGREEEYAGENTEPPSGYRQDLWAKAVERRYGEGR